MGRKKKPVSKKQVIEDDTSVSESTRKRGKKIPTVDIKLGKKGRLVAETYSWRVQWGGQTAYYPTLMGAIQFMFDQNVSEQKAHTLEELVEAIVSAQSEILELLAPFCFWHGERIHLLLSEEFRKTVSELGVN